jgi:hypothetical protein
VDALSGVLNEARRRLAPLNVFLAADVFGYVAWNLSDTGIGQKIEKVAALVDYVFGLKEIAAQIKAPMTPDRTAGCCGIRTMSTRRRVWGAMGRAVHRILLLPHRSEILNHLRRKSGPQGIEYSENVDHFLSNRAAHRT